MRAFQVSRCYAGDGRPMVETVQAQTVELVDGSLVFRRHDQHSSEMVAAYKEWIDVVEIREPPIVQAMSDDLSHVPLLKRDEGTDGSAYPFVVSERESEIIYAGHRKFGLPITFRLAWVHQLVVWLNDLWQSEH